MTVKDAVATQLDRLASERLTIEKLLWSFCRYCGSEMHMTAEPTGYFCTQTGSIECRRINECPKCDKKRGC